MFNSDNFSIISYKQEMHNSLLRIQTSMKLNSINEQKLEYKFIIYHDKAFKITIVDWVLPSLHDRSIARTVPFLGKACMSSY